MTKLLRGRRLYGLVAVVILGFTHVEEEAVTSRLGTEDSCSDSEFQTERECGSGEALEEIQEEASVYNSTVQPLTARRCAMFRVPSFVIPCSSRAYRVDFGRYLDIFRM